MLPPQCRRDYLFRLRPLRLALEGERVSEAKAEMEAWGDPLAQVHAFHGTFRVGSDFQALLDRYGASHQHPAYEALSGAARQGDVEHLRTLTTQHRFPACVWDSVLSTALANGQEAAAWWILPRASRLGGASVVVGALHAGQSTTPAHRLSARLITHLLDTLSPGERLRQLPDLIARSIRTQRQDLLPRFLRRWKRVAHRAEGRILVEEMVLQEALVQDNPALAQRLTKFFKLDLGGWTARQHVDGIAPTPAQRMESLEQWQFAMGRAQKAATHEPAPPAKVRRRC